MEEAVDMPADVRSRGKKIILQSMREKLGGGGKLMMVKSCGEMRYDIRKPISR